jgi:hypothetical protein
LWSEPQVNSASCSCKQWDRDRLINDRQWWLNDPNNLKVHPLWSI